MPTNNRMNCMVPNFRDVGMTVNALAGTELMKPQTLYRGGSIWTVSKPSEIANIRTIVNLTRGGDPSIPKTQQVHVPAPHSVDIYAMNKGHNLKWIASVLEALTSEELQLPVLVHCVAGKDRTGLVIAAVLVLCGVPEEVIEKDYLTSSGTLEPAKFKLALKEMTHPNFLGKKRPSGLIERYGLS